MIGFEFDNTVVLEQQKVLEAALSTNPKTQKALQGLIRKAISQARAEVVRSVSASIANDPRHAARAVRTAVYKKVLGANINIYNSRKAHGSTNYEPPRKLRPHQRGGNRVPRGQRTDTIMHYGPHDRQWILRFINSGTTDRQAGTRGGSLSGNRGRIAPRNFFRGAASSALAQAADNLATLIDTELEAILNKK